MAKPLPPQSVLRELFDYNPDTGYLTHKHTDRRRKKGERVGHVSMNGTKNRHQRNTKIKGERYYVSRIIYTWMTGIDPADLEIDHINRDSLDDRWENLRAISHRENLENRNVKRVKGRYSSL